MLREYQQRCLDQLYDWFRAGNNGNVCINMPTGSGKSHIIAALCKDALQNWPETRILMLTHVRELILQDHEKLRLHWPGAPVGICSAGLGKNNLDEPITFAGVQSIRKKVAKLGHIDICIIDEAHLVSHKDEGSYREILNYLLRVNPAMRIIGLSASPYRLGHGMITDKPAIFDDIIEPVSIEELVYKGYLAPLRSKMTSTRLSTDGVHKRGGEFIESELQAAVDKDDKNEAVVREVISLAGDRKCWLFFCSGVQHARHIKDCLIANGITAECVTGDTPKHERDRILDDFKSGKIRAVTNANVMTTGINIPDIDMIAMLRPTMSPGLYLQCAGRGMRPKSHTDHCLFLDFAGVVSTHGPITAVKPPKKGGEGNGEAPVKVCDNCNELCAISAKVCPACGNPFPEPEKKKLTLHNDDIMGIHGTEMAVTGWQWRKHISRASGKEMLSCTIYGGISDKPVTSYHPVLHEGYAGQKSRQEIAYIAEQANAKISYSSADLTDLAIQLNKGMPPSMIEYKVDGKFFRVIRREW